jgi:hypothetical protein
MRTYLVVTVALLLTATPASLVRAQTFPTDDPVIQAMWAEGMENSRAYALAQALLDSIGPRLTGSPAHEAANEWAVAMLRRWGIEARNEKYGMWTGWRRGTTHIDLLSPRVRTLEGLMLAWSPGTDGPIEAGVVLLPDEADEVALEAWLPSVEGKFVLISYPQSTCRPEENWEEHGTPASLEAMQAARDATRKAQGERMETLGGEEHLHRRLENAGAVGIISSNWSGGWGAHRVFGVAPDHRAPAIALSCEDFGLVYRLAHHGQNPVLRVDADAEFLGDVPVFNTIGEIPGSEKPDEYVLLSAHFDSWDGASGATDNGTGSVTMLETMRILKTVYPSPKRTILLGLWSGEEQGLNGSRAFVADHPEIVGGLQALFNQDNGTGRVARIPMQGLTEAGAHFGRWLARVPPEITQHIELGIPGMPGGGGSDYASFVCTGAPAFGLWSLSWDYFSYTWHTNRDTFDKVVFDEIRNNAVLIAMLAYLASEDPERVPRDRRVMPVDEETGEVRSWPACREPRRSADAADDDG